MGALGACSKAPPAAPSVPVAAVRVVPLQVQPLQVRIRAYGFTLGAPGDEWNVVRAYDTAISRVYVVPGQRVRKGQRLLKLVPGPAAMLQAAQLQSKKRAAQALLAGVQRRYRLQLATQAQLQAAQQRFDDLKLRLRVLHQGAEVVRAPAPGIVAELPFVAAGAIIPAGQTVALITAGRDLQARLGIEPEAARNVTPGATVTVRALTRAGAAVIGHIRSVSGAVSPRSGLVNVFVTLPPDAPFLVGQYVRAALTTATGQGFVVPRSAVLPLGAGHVLYTIREGRAVQQQVRVVLANSRSYEVAAPSLRIGEPVVVQGNYELRPGMRVRVRP